MRTKLNRSILVLFILFGLNQIFSWKATKAHKDSLIGIVHKYYNLNLKIFQANSTKADIDQAFILFTNDFTYVHDKYGEL